jgi:hypothetical protein
MAAFNLILALLVVAGVATVMLLGFFAGHAPDYVQLPAEEPQQDRDLELAA